MNTQANTHGTTGRVVSTGQSKLHNGAALQGGKEGGNEEKKSSARSLSASAWPAALAREARQGHRSLGAQRQPRTRARFGHARGEYVYVTKTFRSPPI